MIQNQTYKELNTSDSDIVREFLRTRDQRLFSTLYRKYAAKVYGKCLSILKSPDDAHDAVQDIFVKIMSNLASFGEKSQFSTWVYSITYNYCIDIVRKKKKEKVLFSDEMERAADVEADEIPDEHLMAMEMQYLKSVLEILPTGDKMILIMKYQDDLSIKEISEIIDKTESAVKMKIKRAKEKAIDIFNDITKGTELAGRH